MSDTNRESASRRRAEIADAGPGPWRRVAKQHMVPCVIRMTVGLIAGAFASRLLAEQSGQMQIAFFRWGPTLALSLTVGIAFVAVYVLRTRRRQARQIAWNADVFFPWLLLVLYLVQPTPDLLQAGVLFGGALALSLLLADDAHPRDLLGLSSEWPIWSLLFLVSLIAYLNTLMPAVGTRDGYELQAVSATLGFAHPTGYPLFPILGRLWIAIFPFGAIAWRINALCALFAAASVSLVYGTARRVLGRGGRAAAAWGALLFAFSHTLWAQASQPEKYTLNALFVALVLYVAFGTDRVAATTDLGQDRVRRRDLHPHSARRLRWLGFVYGLSLTHHRTMLMLAPALALYVLWRDPGLLKRPKEWLPALGLALAPLLIYLYIPWRAYAQGWAMGLGEFLRYISGTAYGPAVRLMDWASPERSLMFWRFVVTQYGYVGVALGALGAIGLAQRRQWRILACTSLAYATYYVWGTVWYAYYNDVNSFIPNHMILAIWIASGVMTAGGILEFLRAKVSQFAGRRPVYKAAFWSLAALMPMSMIWTNGPQVDMSDQWKMTRWGEQAITLGPGPLAIAPNATILADREKYPPLDYFARIEGRRPDLDVVLLGDEQAYLDRLAWDLARDKPVYLARFLPGLEGPYHLSSAGPLVRVGTAPLTEIGGLEGAPAVVTTPDGTPVELLGTIVHNEQANQDDMQPRSLAAGTSLRITLLWRVQASMAANYHVALRLVSESGRPWWSASDHPVSGMYPTAAWKPGEIVADWHEVPIDRALAPGTYTLEAGLLPPFAREGLSSRNGDGSWTPLTRLTVTLASSNPKPDHRLSAVAPDRLRLLGYDLADQAPPTGRIWLRLYWQALPAPGSLPNYQIGTRVIAAGRKPREETSEREWTWVAPGKGEYPTRSWRPGTTIVTEHTLIMPPREGQATVQIAVKRTEDASGDKPILFIPRWLAPQTPIVTLSPIWVAGRPPAEPGAINFGDRILLLARSGEDDLGWRTLSPGAPLELTLRWQGLQSMEADYTLFIHLLAPDGTLQGQIDVWPKDGTYPTSQWRPGESFEDRYMVYVDPDAPPGAYQVEIGWYLLETMQRLPVLDAQGRAIEDRVLLSGLTIE